MDLPLVITYSVEVYFTKWKYPQHYSAVFSGFCCNSNLSASAARYIKLRDHAHITSSLIYNPQSGSYPILDYFMLQHCGMKNLKKWANFSKYDPPLPLKSDHLICIWSL